MIYYRCKCGKMEGWSSMGMPDCSGCRDCGTSLATNEKLHRPVKDHLVKIKSALVNSEIYYESTCIFCLKSLKEIHEDNEPFEIQRDE